MKTKVLRIATLISLSIIIAAGFMIYLATNAATAKEEQNNSDQPSKQTSYSLPNFVPMAKIGY